MVLTRKGATIYDKDNAIVHREAIKHSASTLAGRQGELPPLHGQGNPRAAGSGRPYAGALCRHGDRARGAAGQAAVRLQGHPAHLDHRLRHRELCRLCRQILVRAARAACRSNSMSPPNSAIARRRLRKGDLAIFISQSGETADTLAALRYAKAQGVHTLSVVNVPTSTIARESETVLPTLAGPEIGVASTKAFTCQLMVLAALAVAAGKARGELSDDDEAKLVHGLVEIPRLMAAALDHRAADREAGARDREIQGRALSRPRHQLSAGAGRRAEAEGNLLHPRRGLCRRRTQARADRADRREHAGRGDRAATTGCSRRPSPTCRKSPPAAARSS